MTSRGGRLTKDETRDIASVGQWEWWNGGLKHMERGVTMIAGKRVHRIMRIAEDTKWNVNKDLFAPPPEGDLHIVFRAVLGGTTAEESVDFAGINASPWGCGKSPSRDAKHLASLASLYRTFCIVVNELSAVCADKYGPGGWIYSMIRGKSGSGEMRERFVQLAMIA